MAIHIPDKELLSRLVAHDSTSARSNLPIGEFVCDYLDRPGIEVTRVHSADVSKVNVVAWLGPESGEQRRGLVLSGHLDAVPATEGDWKSDPFRLEQRDGCWYGRGTCDMKGFDALAMNVFTSVDRRYVRHPLVAIFTYDEELGSLGAQRLAERWPKQRPFPKAAIIGEPTSLRAVRLHKGHLKMRVRHRGRSAHSGSPHLGINAIEPMGAIIAALAELRAELEGERCPTSRFFPTVPFTALNVARVRGGDALNVIPDECELDLGVRVLPGEDSSAMIERVTAVVRGAASEHPLQIEVLNDNPAMLLEETAPIYVDLCRRLDQKEAVGVSFSSDGGVFRRDLEMDCVLYGPGTIEVAHRADEHVPIAEMTTARSMLETLVRRHCLDQET